MSTFCLRKILNVFQSHFPLENNNNNIAVKNVLARKPWQRDKATYLAVLTLSMLVVLHIAFSTLHSMLHVISYTCSF